jgi:hypothetical protein
MEALSSNPSITGKKKANQTKTQTTKTQVICVFIVEL